MAKNENDHSSLTVTRDEVLKMCQLTHGKTDGADGAAIEELKRIDFDLHDLDMIRSIEKGINMADGKPVDEKSITETGVKSVTEKNVTEAGTKPRAEKSVTEDGAKSVTEKNVTEDGAKPSGNDKQTN